MTEGELEQFARLMQKAIEAVRGEQYGSETIDEWFVSVGWYDTLNEFVSLWAWMY